MSAFSLTDLNLLTARRRLDFGVDLGTCHTLLCAPTCGIVLREPSVIAVDYTQASAKAFAAGNEALAFQGRGGQSIQTKQPVSHGVVSDFDAAHAMLSAFIRHAKETHPALKGRTNRILVGVPSRITSIERQAVAQVSYASGAQQAYLIEEPLAAAIGAGLPVQEASGSLIVDLGGGTTDIAVLSLGRVVVSQSLRLAGVQLTEKIQSMIRQTHRMMVGEHTAEKVKLALASALRPTQYHSLPLYGLDLLTGEGKSIEVSNQDVFYCVEPFVHEWVQAVRHILETAPPELMSDVVRRGIFLTGGTALLPGLGAVLSQATKIPVHLVSDPLLCVVLGTESVLHDPAYHELLTRSAIDRDS